FLAGRGDALPAIDALSLFYDYRELTPIGRRGDEMIRRLAERLVSVDLLDQAAELLQYQVDNRLQVEARALSDLGRHDFALEVIAGIEGRESLRLRSDIYWAARNWQKAAEHIELLYGDRWKSFEPLTDTERMDILRAGVAYGLADDKLGSARLKDKYAAKMAEGPDRRAFELITSGVGAGSAEFRAVARQVAVADTLTGFLRDLKARYPDMAGALTGGASEPAAAPDKAKPDPRPTGAIERGAPRLSAR